MDSLSDNTKFTTYARQRLANSNFNHHSIVLCVKQHIVEICNRKNDLSENNH
jgi:hypothetical protein